jgi:hypothetical protein
MVPEAVIVSAPSHTVIGEAVETLSAPVGNCAGIGKKADPGNSWMK